MHVAKVHVAKGHVTKGHVTKVHVVKVHVAKVHVAKVHDAKVYVAEMRVVNVYVALKYSTPLTMNSPFSFCTQRRTLELVVLLMLSCLILPSLALIVLF